MSVSNSPVILSGILNLSDGSQIDLAQVRDEVTRLRDLTASLHSALGLAVYRLEEGGLPHQDLRAPLQATSHILRVDAADAEAGGDAVPVGPYVFGTLRDVPPVAGLVRFIFDCGTDRVERLQWDLGAGWVTAEPALMETFRTWILEENEDMIDHPENWELEKSEFLPIWRR